LSKFLRGGRVFTADRFLRCRVVHSCKGKCFFHLSLDKEWIGFYVYYAHLFKCRD